MSKTVSIMINACYGGFGLSDIAIREYNTRKPIDCKSLNMENSLGIDRADPLMTQICTELGAKVNDSNKSNIIIKSIPLKYAECYVITENDGNELISIDMFKFQVDSIRLVMQNSSISNTDKVNLINIILECDLENFFSSDDDDDDTEEEIWPLIT